MLITMKEEPIKIDLCSFIETRFYLHNSWMVQNHAGFSCHHDKIKNCTHSQHQPKCWPEKIRPVSQIESKWTRHYQHLFTLSSEACARGGVSPGTWVRLSVHPARRQRSRPGPGQNPGDWGFHSKRVTDANKKNNWFLETHIFEELCHLFFFSR